MPTPYNLKIQDHCTECTLRKDRAFCNMSAAAVAGMESVKFTGVYPKDVQKKVLDNWKSYGF